MKTTRTVALDQDLIGWIDARAKKQDSNFSQLVNGMLRKEMEMNTIDARSSITLAEEAKKHAEMAQTLSARAQEARMAEDNRAVSAAEEAERILAARQSVEGMSHDDVVSRANEWVENLNEFDRARFYSFVRVKGIKVSEAYLKAMEVSFPLNPLPE